MSAQDAVRSRVAARAASPLALRPVAFVALTLAEGLITSLLFAFELDVPRWQHPSVWMRHAAMLLLIAMPAFVLLVWPRRLQLAADWRAEGAQGSMQAALAVNLALFICLAISTAMFSRHAAVAATPPWGWFAALTVLVGATGVSLLALLAAPRFLLQLARREAAGIVAALGLALAVMVVSTAASNGWDHLAGLTLKATYGLLSLYETGVFIDEAEQLIGIGDFEVVVSAACSRYEGVGLVIVFVSLFLWTFRSTLRFPHAFLLLPFGIMAIWLLNAVRLAVLVSIGAHISPEVAVTGFHSQAGWMSFLVVTISMMVAAHRLPWLAVAGGTAKGTPSPTVAPPATREAADERQLAGHIVPFMAMMAGGLVAAAAAPYDQWLYGVKVVAAAAALWWFADVNRATWSRVSPLAIAVGLAVGALWIATDPGSGTESALGKWIVTLPIEVAAAWLAVRAVGTIVVVPIVEEIAFRGMLYRWVIAARFHDVPYTQLSLVALGVSSLLFGLLHERWIAGALAGAVFAGLMLRSGRLSDAIAAHVAANAIIFAWALALRQWSLL